MAAFPELQLYMYARDGGMVEVSGGRSNDDEWQRTMGALFAVYWLMRIDGDGPQSFAFGVGHDWKPLSSNSPSPRRSAAELERRAAFLDSVNWAFLKEPLCSGARAGSREVSYVGQCCARCL